jgi:hypothetical protein
MGNEILKKAKKAKLRRTQAATSYTQDKNQAFDTGFNFLIAGNKEASSSDWCCCCCCC